MWSVIMKGIRLPDVFVNTITMVVVYVISSNSLGLVVLIDLSTPSLVIVRQSPTCPLALSLVAPVKRPVINTHTLDM